MGYQPQETWGNAWEFPATAPEDSLLQIQPGEQSTATEQSGEQSIAIEQSGGDQDSEQAVSNLEGRVDKLEELVESLRNE